MRADRSGWKLPRTSTRIEVRRSVQYSVLVAIHAVTVRALRSEPPAAAAEGWLGLCNAKLARDPKWDGTLQNEGDLTVPPKQVEVYQVVYWG